MTTKIKFNIDMVMSFVLFLISIFAYKIIINSEIVSTVKHTGLTSYFFPKMISYSLILLTLILVFDSFIKMKKVAGTDKEHRFKNIHFKQFIATIFLLFLYIYFIPILGYFFTSSLFLIIFTYSISQIKDFKKNLFFFIILILFIFIFFQKFLQVYMPRGLFF